MRGYAPYDSTKTCSTYATGRTYSYDSAGRLTNYEGTAMTAVRGHSTFPTGAYSSFDNNGNYTALGTSRTLSWDHENRLASISGGTNESYLYDPDGQRVKKSSSAETVYYANQFYEVKNGVATKYYFFNGARVATRQGSGPLMYLYSDHLGSTVYTTHDGGTFINEQGYYAYGRYRRGGAIPTDHKFTGQKLDATGLQYFNARYYNPDSGQFLSPDTLVPEPGNLFDYNRYMYVRGNPLKYNDPTGHQCTDPSDGNTDYNSCSGIVYSGSGSTSSNRAPAPSTGGGFFSSIGSALRAAGSRLSSWWRGADQSQITKQQAQKNTVNDPDVDDVPVPGTVSFMSNKDQFYKNAQKRADVDPDGFLDVIAHGSSTQVEVTTLNGRVLVNHRTFGNLIEQQAEYTGQPIRLLSCSTGACSNGFAQNLANKLNTTVRAPSDILWAHPNGNLTIGPSPYVNTGTWIDFVPSPTK